MTQVSAIDVLQTPGEPWDFQKVYAEHVTFIHGLVRRLLGPGGDAEDVTQEVFLVALRKMPNFGGTHPRSWLARIAVQLVRNVRRNARLRRALSWAQPRSELVDRRTPEQAASTHESTRELYRALDRLSEDKRTAFILFEIEELSCAEISALVGCPAATVYTRLHYARREVEANLRAPSGQPDVAGRGGTR